MKDNIPESLTDFIIEEISSKGIFGKNANK